MRIALHHRAVKIMLNIACIILLFVLFISAYFLYINLAQINIPLQYGYYLKGKKFGSSDISALYNANDKCLLYDVNTFNTSNDYFYGYHGLRNGNISYFILNMKTDEMIDSLNFEEFNRLIANKYKIRNYWDNSTNMLDIRLKNGKF